MTWFADSAECELAAVQRAPITDDSVSAPTHRRPSLLLGGGRHIARVARHRAVEMFLSEMMLLPAIGGCNDKVCWQH